jgi:uncharacterized lipoprotein YddW (UPF0748 family)
MNPYNYYQVPQQMQIDYHTYVPSMSYGQPEAFNSYGQVEQYQTFGQANPFDPDRQPPQFQNLERRVDRLERENERQAREINQLQRRLQRVNQRLRAVERRLNIGFTPFDGEY